MPTTLNVTSGFSGSLAGEIFVQAFKKSDTISKGAITVIPNALGTGYLPKLSYSAGLSTYACGWNPTGTVNYSDKSVALKKYTIQHELCKAEFASTFQAQALGLFNADSEVPATILEAILMAMVDNMAAVVDTQIWTGIGGTGANFNGLLTQFAADTDVVKVATPVAITATNVFAEMNRAWNLVIAEVDEDPNLIIVASKNVGKAYKQATSALVGQAYQGDKELDYLGNKMVTIAGLPSNTFAIYRTNNVAFFTGVENDMNEVRISDDAERLDGNVRTKMSFTAGVGYSFGTEIVLYKA